MDREWQALLPSAEDVAFYRENGYWLAPRILSDAELEALREHHARVVAGCYETTRARPQVPHPREYAELTSSRSHDRKPHPRRTAKALAILDPFLASLAWFCRFIRERREVLLLTMLPGKWLILRHAPVVRQNMKECFQLFYAPADRLQQEPRRIVG